MSDSATGLKRVVVHTDGGCQGNPGPGAWACVLQYGRQTLELCGGELATTNNRMELLSVIAALGSLTRKGLNIVIYSDSQYVVKAVQEGWLQNWMRTDFKGGKKNSDLWRRYHELAAHHHIKFVWVKGHASNPYNNRCDELATAAADGGDLDVDEGYESGAAG